jgi:hypothetical protein
MKKILLIAFALMVSFAANAQKADIEFEKTTIDLGKFGSDNVIQKCHFVFKNTGDADLYIHQILTSCGCTSKEYPKYGIKPGASDTIFITYDGSKKAPKKFRTSITIHSNAKQEMTKVYIKGEQLARPIQEVEEIQVEE